MRISDWSSDVCSSDLKPAKEEEKPAKEAVAEDEEEEDEAAASTPEGKRVKASPLARKIAKEKGIDISKVAGSAPGGRIVKKDVEAYEPEKAAPAAEAGASAKPAAASVVAGQERSEEHTSELQSLMRISYAVFCLKKKNAI